MPEKETVLIVDDDHSIIDVGSEMLGIMGHKSFTASSGEEGIKIYRKEKNNIDIIILDMTMPGMSGGETFDAIKEINAEVKIILSSGFSNDGQAKEILDRGCNGFIQKPFKIKTLVSKINQVMNG